MNGPHRSFSPDARHARAGALASAAGAAGALAARQGSVPPCPSQTLVQPFLPWHDLGAYFLAPGGAFESTPTGWQLAGSAQVVPGNESSHVNDPSDANSVSLGNGSSATSPQICVTIHDPNIRLFARNPGSPRSLLQVSINYTDRRGLARTFRITTLRAAAAWTLSSQIVFIRYIAPVVGGQGQTWVSFTFQPTSGGSWQIDDFYVDPMKSQ